ncbi:MAG: ATP-binding protein [Planctomycetota bacterium]
MILLVTGRGSVANRVEGFNAGADDYIPKPFNHPELLARVRSALRLKQLTNELEERNQELLVSQQELIRKEKMATIGLLASGIAHEFNNVMAGISGYAQLAKANPKFHEPLVEVALVQTERAMELTRSLSTYHRHSKDRSFCDVESVANAALCLVRKQIEEKGIDLEANFEINMPRASIKPGQMQEILLNLIINGIHATPSRGSIKVSCETHGDEILLVVEDSGVGIPPENLHRIFDPFFTTKGALGGGDVGGSGLGLSVCANIVQGCGGRIDVESDVGQGTTIRIALPVADGAPLEEPSEFPMDSSAQASQPSESLRVLIAEDEGHVRNMLAAYLEEHEVVCCANGESAVEEYRKKKFDYVILDLCMAESIGGTETFERLQNVDDGVKVILASGRMEEDIDAEILERAHGHLLKPYSFDDLSELMGITSLSSSVS